MGPSRRVPPPGHHRLWPRGPCGERGDCPSLAGAQPVRSRWITSEIRGKSSRFPDFALRPLSLDPPFWHSDTRSSRSTGRRSAKPQGDVDGGARDLERGTESLTGRWGSAHRSHDEYREHRRHTVARPTRVSARRAFGDPERLEGLPTGHSGSSAFHRGTAMVKGARTVQRYGSAS